MSDDFDRLYRELVRADACVMQAEVAGDPAAIDEARDAAWRVECRLMDLEDERGRADERQQRAWYRWASF